jgi:hypothetical protein
MLTKQKLHKLSLLVSAGIVFHGTMLFIIVDGILRFDYLMFFTVISNLLIVIGFLIKLISYGQEGKFWYYILMSMLMSISATALTYNLVLVPFGGSNIAFSSYPNFAVHLFSVVLVFINYLFFEKKGMLKFSHVLAGLVVPFVYYLVFLSIGHIIDYYPYFFMRPDVVGWPMVFILFGVLMGLLFLFGFLILLLDKWLYKYFFCPQKN